MNPFDLTTFAHLLKHFGQPCSLLQPSDQLQINISAFQMIIEVNLCCGFRSILLFYVAAGESGAL